MILLCDFTKENGVPYILPNSREMTEPPSEEYFYKNVLQITGKAGDVIYINLRI